MKNVLPIEFSTKDGGIGDYFTIKNGEKYNIFDGGNKKISSFPEKVDVIICSHNDTDHTTGIKSILKNQNTAVDEVWLPGQWQPILSFMEENLNSIAQKYNYHINRFHLADDIIDFQGSIEQFVTNTEASIEKYELSFDKNCYLNFSFPLLSNDRCSTSLKQIKMLIELLFKLNNILEIWALAYYKGCKIRWFFPELIMTDELHYPFIAKNSRELRKVKKVKDDSFLNFLCLLYLSNENKYSLVFEYLNDEKQPIILFTADSDLSFAHTKIDYKQDNILITAPHHGSESNKDAYSKLRGRNIIWIKSGGSQNCKTGKTYINLGGTKYCNKCSNTNKQANSCNFEFSNNNWIYKNGGYKCTC